MGKSLLNTSWPYIAISEEGKHLIGKFSSLADRPDEDAGVMVAATGKSIGSDVGYLQAWILEFQMRTYLLTEGTSKLQSRENTLWI
jgi:hypothetical protein